MTDMMRPDEQPTWDGMTPRQMQLEIERLRAQVGRWAEMERQADAEIERLKAALRGLISEHEVYHGNIAAGTWEPARDALEGK